MTIIIGLCELLGQDQVDMLYPQEYLFKNNSFSSPTSSLYGKGYSYANTLEPLKGFNSEPESVRRPIMIERLKNREYDLVIYSEFLAHREFFADYAYTLYYTTPERLWLLDGRDKFYGWPFQMRFGTLRYNSTIFVRELF